MENSSEKSAKSDCKDKRILLKVILSAFFDQISNLLTLEHNI